MVTTWAHLDQLIQVGLVGKRDQRALGALGACIRGACCRCCCCVPGSLHPDATARGGAAQGGATGSRGLGGHSRSAAVGGAGDGGVGHAALLLLLPGADAGVAASHAAREQRCHAQRWIRVTDRSPAGSWVAQLPRWVAGIGDAGNEGRPRGCRASTGCGVTGGRPENMHTTCARFTRVPKRAAVQIRRAEGYLQRHHSVAPNCCTEISPV